MACKSFLHGSHFIEAAMREGREEEGRGERKEVVQGPGETRERCIKRVAREPSRLLARLSPFVLSHSPATHSLSLSLSASFSLLSEHNQ